MRPYLPVLLALLVPCCAIGRRCASPRKAAPPWPTRVVPHAAGATRLLLSPKGSFMLAEVRGRWLFEEYDRGAFVPGVLKLLDAGRKVARAALGWALGPPDDQGRQWMIEEGPEEFQYRVRRLEARHPTTALTPPEGFWHMKAALGLPIPSTCMAAVLSSPVMGFNDHHRRRDRLWLTSFDPETGKPLGTRLVEATTPTGEEPFDHGIALGGPPASPIIAWVELPALGAKDVRWRVTALDCKTLKTLWQVRLPRPPPPPPEPSRLTKGKVAPPPVKPAKDSDGHERLLKSANLAFSGDGQHLAVLYGAAGRISVDVRAVYVLAPKTGEITAQLHHKDVPFFHAHRLAPVPGRPAVVALSVAKVRALLGEHTSNVYFGAVEISLAPAKITQIVEISRSLGSNWKQVRAMTPHALVVQGEELLLAPESFDWVRSQKIAGDWPTGEGTGAKRPEVASWIKLPLEWHRAQRPRVKAHAAWMKAASVAPASTKPASTKPASIRSPPRNP